jgi:hypothetical protein
MIGPIIDSVLPIGTSKAEAVTWSTPVRSTVHFGYAGTMNPLGRSVRSVLIRNQGMQCLRSSFFHVSIRPWLDRSRLAKDMCIFHIGDHYRGDVLATSPGTILSLKLDFELLRGACIHFDYWLPLKPQVLYRLPVAHANMQHNWDYCRE